MVRIFKKSSKMVGLPPGALVHVGDEKTAEVKITVMDYDEAQFQEREVRSVEECVPYKDKPSVTWINLDGIHRVEIVEALGKSFDLHPLILEDILNTGQRPKLEDFSGYLYIVLKMITYGDSNGAVKVEQVSLVLGPNFVISFQEAEGDIFDPVRDRIRTAKGRIRKRGADYLAYSLIDAVVDNYFVVLEKFGEEIEDLEEELVSEPTSDTIQDIHRMKREMIFLRRSVWPLREVVSGLRRGESPLINKETAVYLGDAYDHIIQVIDTVESYRDMVAGMLDIYLSSLTYKMNQIMKVLTIIATIFIPLTFLTGVYGMNFHFMPELGWRWSYPIFWAVSAGIVIWMLFYFKRKKWL